MKKGAGMIGLERLYRSYFDDNNKQEGIDLLLGRKHQEPLEDDMAFEEVNEEDATEGEEKISLAFYSWDVASRTPDNLLAKDLESFFEEENPKEGASQRAPSIIFVGLQQITNSSKYNLIKHSFFSSPGNIVESWKEGFLSALSTKYPGKYQMVECVFAHGSLLMMFSDVDIVTSIQKVSHDSIIDWNGFGAAGIRCHVNNSKISVISCCVNPKDSSTVNFKQLLEIHQSLFQKESIGKRKQEKVEKDDCLFLMGVVLPSPVLIGANPDFLVVLQEFKKLMLSYLENGRPLGNPKDPKFKEILRKLHAYDDFFILRESDAILSDSRLKILKNYEEAPVSFLPTHPLEIKTTSFDFSQWAGFPSWRTKILFQSPQKTVKIQQRLYRTFNIAFSASRYHTILPFQDGII